MATAAAIASFALMSPLPSTPSLSPSCLSCRLCSRLGACLPTSCSKSFCAAKNSAVLRKKHSRPGYDDDCPSEMEFNPRNPTRFRRHTCATRACALPVGKNYEFREDGSELEVRVPLPSMEDAGRQITARYVAVDCQSTTLTVGVDGVEGVQILLNATLFGSIKPSETVWFVDETEVVLSLKKADSELSWPDLIETWQSSARGVSTLLKGASVYVVGDSTEINWAVAQDLAAGLEYVPLQTQQLIEGVAKASISETCNISTKTEYEGRSDALFSATNVVMEDGEDAIGEIEDTVLKSLSQHVRCVVATLGGSNGAAAQFSRWSGLHSGFSVWLPQSQAHDEVSAIDEGLISNEVRSLAYAKADVVVTMSGWDSTAGDALRALKYLLMAEKDLPGKKSLYVRLGCRGDWPEIMPPGWDPNRPEDEVKRAEQLAV